LIWLIADLVWLIEVIAAAEMWQLCLFITYLKAFTDYSTMT